MKITITGGCGYVGSVVALELLKAGHEVTCLDVLERGSDGVFACKSYPNYNFINADINGRFLQFSMREAELVLHLAAVVGDPACAAEPEKATLINVEGSKAVIDACEDLQVPLIVASTCSVYGSNPRPCTEKSVLNPLSHYARTKIEMENYLRTHSSTGIALRFGTMYGQSPNMRYDLVVNRLTLDAVETSSFRVFGGLQYRPFLHPKDLATLLLNNLETDFGRFKGETFNVVSENLSMLELGDIVEKTIPRAAMEVVEGKEDNRTYICKSLKAHTFLGFSPQIRVSDGVREMERAILTGKQRSRGSILNT